MTKRMSALIAGGAAAVSVVALATPAQAAAPANDGSAWLVSQLTNGLVHNPNYGGFDDYGLSIDFALALDSAGLQPATVTQIQAAVTSHTSDYTTGSAWGYPGDIYSGATGKLLVAQGLGGGTPSAALVTQLEGRVATTSPIAGRIQDGVDPGDGFGGDYANVIGQGFAARALAAAGSPKAASATSFLIKQQCGAGFFRLSFTADKTAATQSCDSAAGTADVDATALAVINLRAMPSTPAIAYSIAKARTWLASVQLSDGSWSESSKAADPHNAESTGLAVQAIGASQVALRGQAWIGAHRAQRAFCADTAPGIASGVVFHTDTEMTAAKKDGITDATSDSARRATADTLVAETLLPATFKATVPAFSKAGSPMKVTVTDRSGTLVCAKGATTASAISTGTSAVTVGTPTVTNHMTVSVSDSQGQSTNAIGWVLGKLAIPTTLSSTSPARGATETVRGTGLVAGESYSIYFRGAKAASGVASSTGAFKATFPVNGAAGKVAVVVKGQYGDIRSSYTTVTVR